MMITPFTSWELPHGKMSDNAPIVMGIANLTPDSFYEKSRFSQVDDAIRAVETMYEAGARIIDLGGMSTRPGAHEIALKEEIFRLIPVVESVIRLGLKDLLISVDTYRAEVAKEVLAIGVDIINDIGGGRLSERMIEVMAAHPDRAYVLMHSRGTPATMAGLTHYDDVVEEVWQYLRNQLNHLHEAGVYQVIIDPGLGFAKTPAQSLELLDHTEEFLGLGAPVMIGLSRKRMVYGTLGINAEDSLLGTTALHMIALERGAHILRVHDVAEAMQVVKIHQALEATRQEL